jgi:hypothetical protein
MRVTFSDLVVQVAPEQMSTLLQDWDWLLGRAQACLVTSAGDVFFSDPRGAICILDIEEAHFELAAPGADEFRAGLRDPKTAHRWLGVDRYLRWRGAQLLLAPGQFFSFIKPLCLGGEDSADNVEASDPVVTIPILGQIHNRIRSTPDGTRIGEIKLE